MPLARLARLAVATVDRAATPPRVELARGVYVDEFPGMPGFVCVKMIGAAGALLALTYVAAAVYTADTLAAFKALLDSMDPAGVRVAATLRAATAD